MSSDDHRPFRVTVVTLLAFVVLELLLIVARLY